jgi:hypothetical protein
MGERGTERVKDYTVSYGAGNEYHQLGTGFFVHMRIISAVNRVEFASDRMSYITLRCLCLQYYCSECERPM